MEGHIVYVICKKQQLFRILLLDASGCAETLLLFMHDLSAVAATCKAADLLPHILTGPVHWLPTHHLLLLRGRFS